MDKVVDFINVNRDRYIEELKRYLAIPSISALPEHKGDVRRCAEWTRRRDAPHRAAERAARSRRPGNPVVYGEWLGAPGAPTILFYGHYDVQPVDPLESVDVAAVRGDGPRRRDLRARVGRRQGPGLHAHQGGRGALEAERPAAGEHEVLHRRRGGSRQREPRRLHPRAQGRAQRRRRRHLRLADVRSRRPVDLLRPARPRATSRSICAAARPICTPDRSAARSPTRRSCWRRSSRR